MTGLNDFTNTCNAPMPGVNRYCTRVNCDGNHYCDAPPSAGERSEPTHSASASIDVNVTGVGIRCGEHGHIFASFDPFCACGQRRRDGSASRDEGVTGEPTTLREPALSMSKMVGTLKREVDNRRDETRAIHPWPCLCDDCAKPARVSSGEGGDRSTARDENGHPLDFAAMEKRVRLIDDSTSIVALSTTAHVVVAGSEDGRAVIMPDRDYRALLWAAASSESRDSERLDAILRHAEVFGRVVIDFHRNGWWYVNALDPESKSGYGTSRPDGREAIDAALVEAMPNLPPRASRSSGSPHTTPNEER